MFTSTNAPKMVTYTSATAGTSSTATSTSTATPGSALAAFTTASTLTSTACIFGLLSRCLWLASKLNGDLAAQNLLAGKLRDSTLSLSVSRKIDEGVTNWAGGARVGWD